MNNLTNTFQHNGKTVVEGILILSQTTAGLSPLVVTNATINGSILVQRNNISPETLQLIAEGKLKDGDTVLIECDQRAIKLLNGVSGGRLFPENHVYEIEYYIKLNSNNHATIIPVEKDAIKYGAYIQLDDRFETVHIWSKEIQDKIAGKWSAYEITKKEYDDVKNITNKFRPKEPERRYTKEEMEEIKDQAYRRGYHDAHSNNIT